jgi:hypothetical protein
MKTLKTLTTLTLLGGTLTLTTPAQAWIVVRRPVYVAPYMAPYYRYPVVVAPTYYVAPTYVAPPAVIVTGGSGTVAPPIPIGTVVYILPAGAQSANINGVQYYVAGGTYYRPNFGPNGVYYQVAPNPI